MFFACLDISSLFIHSNMFLDSYQVDYQVYYCKSKDVLKDINIEITFWIIAIQKMPGSFPVWFYSYLGQLVNT